MIKRLFFIITYQICDESLNLSFNFTTKKYIQTRDDVYICAHASICIHRKLNVGDFRCKHKGKYTLNVNIREVLNQKGSLKSNHYFIFTYPILKGMVSNV